MKMKIIGIIMTYNCADMLESTYKLIPKKLLSELIVVDDGSKDTTVQVAKKLGLKTFIHKHLGYGGNIKFGLKKAIEMNADCMIEIHGDGQYDVRAIPAALKKIESGADLVLGSRFTNLKQALQDNMSYARYFANLSLSFFDRLILQLPLTEFHTGFRVYTKNLIKTIGFTGTSNDYLYSFEIIAQAKFYGCAIAEVPVRCYYDKKHTSVSLTKATLYSFQTFGTLVQYISARLGWKNKIFLKS